MLNTDSTEFGGDGFVNARVKASKKEEADGRKNSITIKLAPLSVAIFKYTAEKSEVAKKLEQEYIEIEEKKDNKAKETKSNSKTVTKKQDEKAETSIQINKNANKNVSKTRRKK